MEHTQKTLLTPRSSFKVKTLAKIAVLSAVATLLMLFEFPLPFVAPSFYELDFSEVAVLIGGFSMGPMAAVIIEAMKILLNFALNGTITAGVGEVANFVIGCALAVPAALIYRRNRCRRTAFWGLAAGTLCMSAMGAILNYFVLLPAYSFFMGLDPSVFVDMGRAVSPLITDLKTLVLFATVPFNLIKGVIVSLVTLLLYKRISVLLKK